MHVDCLSLLISGCDRAAAAAAARRRGKEKRKGKREGEEGRRRGKEDIPRSVRRQPKEAIQEPNYSQKTSLNDADRWKVHKFHFHRLQQDHGLLDRNTYLCHHLLIISGDLSTG